MVELRILGSLEVVVDGRPVAVGGPRMRAVLAILLAHRGEPLSVHRIVDELWGERPPDTAVKTVQVYVSRLRKLLGEDVLLTRSGGYVLDVGGDQVDAARFERLVRRGQEALAGGDPRGAEALLGDALALWRGPALADVAYEDFAQATIARLDELRVAAVEDRTEARLMLGHHAQLVPELESMVREHPGRERLRRQLMLALYRCGRHADALDAYRVARADLAELGLEPSRELRELELQILNQDPDLGGAGRTWIPPIDRRRVGPLLAVGGVLLLAAALAAVAFRGGDEPASLEAPANSVAMIDPDEKRVVATIPTGIGPTDVAAGPRWIWVANSTDDSVTQIDPRNRKVVSTTSPGVSVAGVAADERGLWVADHRRSRLLRLDAAFRSVVHTLRLVPRPEVLGFADKNIVAVGFGSVWVGSAYGGVARVDALRRRVVDTIALGNHPAAIAVGGGAVWVADDVDNTVTRIDPHSANAITATVAVGQGPLGIAAGAGSIWVANAHDDTVTRLDAATGAVRQTIRVGRRPAGIAFGNGAVWVANSIGGTISRIDPRTGTVSDTIDVGGGPQGVTVAHGRVWVTVQAAVEDPAAAQVARDGVARLLVPGRPQSLDPALDPDFQRLAATCALLYNLPDEPFPAGARVRPELADGPPTVTDEGRTYTFRIRRGFRFSPPSGEPVTAAAIARAIERALHPRMGSYGGSLIQDIDGATAFAAGRAREVRGVSARGQTLVVRLTRPAPDLTARLAAPWFCAVPPSTPIAPKGVDRVPTAGPYYVAAHTPGRSIVLRRNPNYRGTRPRRLTEIRYQIGVSAEQAVSAVEAGRADYAVLHPFFVEANELSDRTERRLSARYGRASAAARAGRQRHFVQPSPTLYSFALNTRRGIFSDVRLRRAVSFAIDRRALAQHTGLGGRGLPTDQLIPAGFPGFDDAVVYPLGGPDLETARKLAGRARRSALLYTCNTPDCTRHGQILRSNLRAIGIELTVRQFALADLFSQVERPGARFDVAYHNWLADYADPSTFIDQLYGPEGLSPARVEDPRLLRRMRAAARMAGTERLRAYAALDRDISRQAAPAAPFATGTVTHFLSERMGCVVLNPIHGLDLAALCARKGQ